jgi:hypothetical protein
MDTANVQIFELRDEAMEELQSLEDWLSTNAKFESFGDYELCSDNEDLVKMSGKFLEHFKPAVKVHYLQICIIHQTFG